MPDSNRSDARELASYGYVQQLKRSMGGFSSFAISFSLISINTGIFAGFGFGLRQFGPAVIWSWCAVLLGQLCVALVIAELSTRFALSGYGYQWCCRLVNPHFGFFAGWLLLLQFLTGFPGVCHALAGYLHGVLPTTLQQALPVPWLTVIVVSSIAVVHLAGIWVASRVNDIGVTAEIIGTVLITGVLLILYGLRRGDGWSVLLETTRYDTGLPAGFAGFALSLLMGAWCLTGFEAAADLAEETHQPRHTVPWAVLWSLVVSGVAGFLMLAAFLLAIDDVTAVQASDTPLLHILRSRLGDNVAMAALLVVFISIFACGVASMAATTRLIFSLARDNMLPASELLKRVGAHRQSPTGAIALVWGVAVLVALTLQKLELITSISATAGYLGYACIVWASLRAPQRRQFDTTFRLGSWRTPVAVAAFAWTLLVVCALTVPEVDGGHLALWSTSAGVAVGLGLYFGLARPRILRGNAGPPSTTLSSDNGAYAARHTTPDQET